MLSPSSSSTNTVTPLDSTITTNSNTTSNSNSSFSLTISNNNHGNNNNGEVTITPKKNKRKRKNKSSSNTNSTSNSTANGSSTDQLNHGSSSLPLATRSGVANPTTSTTDHQQQQHNHSRKSGASSDQHKSKSHSPSPSTSSSLSSHSSSSNHHHHNNNNNQKQVKKNKQQSSSSSTSFKNNQSVATSTTTALVSGTNSKAGSLRGSGGQQQQNFVDKKKKGVLSTNKEIHGNQESKSPTHRQLLKKIKSKVSTENYSQVVKYKCFDSESQGEQELTMKKTSIINMAEIATSMNRRAQYLMKYIGFKTDKTCFFDVNDEIGYILHEHIAEVKKELTENNGKYEEKNVKVQTLTGNTISMDDENQMSKLIDQILQSYVSNYMVCPSCKSIKTTNPIVVDHDQQQRILQEFKDDNNVDDLTEYQEEQLIERLDDFTFFTIQCRDCDHKERIDNANSSDEFIKQILKSRQRNLTKMFKQGQNEENYVEHESVPQVYGYPYQPEPPVYYYPYYVEVIPGEHNVYASAGYYPPPMPNYYGYYPSFYPTQPVFSPHYDIAANQEPTENFERDPVVEQSYKSAGVIAYSIHQGKVYFLLGKENRGGKGDVNPNLNFEKGLSPYKIAKQMFTWSEFGGKKEKTDTNSAETAAREFYEETKAAFGDIYDKLSTSEGYYFENGKYNLFITELEYITSEQIQERSTIDSSVPFTEKVDLAWIDAEELMKRISDRTKQYYHAESGLMKIPVDGNENEFLHPFALSLFRFASKTLTKLIASIKN